MTNSKILDQSIFKKVKEFLDMDGDHPPEDLYKKLFEFRKKIHPDLFRDENDKNEAEERFKLCYKYLDEISEYINKDKIINSTDVVVYDPELEMISTKQNVVNKEREIEKYKEKLEIFVYENKDLKKNINTLQNQIKVLRGKKVEEKTKELLDAFRPSRKRFASFSITLVLTMIAAIFIQVEQISNLISIYSPLKENTLNTLIFFTLILIVSIYLIYYIKIKKIEIISKNVKSQGSINNFLQYLQKQDKKSTFDELDVYMYVDQKSQPKNIIGTYIFSRIFKTREEETLDLLKEIFIYNLFNKKLISHEGTEDMKQVFRIKNSSKHRMFDDTDVFDF